MVGKAKDRRVQRTRKLLLDALMDLILEKGYESITVQDIIDRANVGRSTFYAHFPDKQQLLLSAVEEHEFLFDQQRVAQTGPGERMLSFSLPICQHAAENQRIFQVMFGKQSWAVLQEHVLRTLAGVVRRELTALVPRNGATTVPPEAVVQYTVSSFMALLLWWLEQKTPCSPEEMDRTFRALTLPGIKATLNLPATLG